MKAVPKHVADPRLNQSFKGTDVARVKWLIAEQICGRAGGGCHYSGDSMRDVHVNHNVTQTEFFGLLKDLRKALRRHHMRLRERNELLALLAPMASIAPRW
jgi:hemoglobin